MYHSVILGMIYGTLIFGAVKLFLIIRSRNQLVDEFFDAVLELIDNYYEHNPKAPGDYFEGIICPKFSMKCQFWISDLAEFFVDSYKMDELIEFNKKLEAGMLYEQKSEQLEDINIICPWCGTKDTDKFSWISWEEDNEEGYGAIQCQVCGMTTPQSKKQECVDMIQDEK